MENRKSPWYIYMNGVIREMKGKVREVGVRMFDDEMKWVLNLILFADDMVLIA